MPRARSGARRGPRRGSRRAERVLTTRRADHHLRDPFNRRIDLVTCAFIVTAKYYFVLPDSDHLFHNFPTEQDSMKNFQKGKFNNAFSKVMKDWIKDVMSGKA